MANMRVFAGALLAGLAAAAPVTSDSMTVAASSTGTAFVAVDEYGTIPGYSNANAPFADYTPTPITVTVSTFGLDSAISAIKTTAPSAGQPGAADTLRTLNPTGPTSHGPYSGMPTTTGAVMNSPLASTIAPGPPNPTATYYNTDGLLQNQQPIVCPQLSYPSNCNSH